MKGNKPQISIIIPCYNAEDTIDRCLKSIIAQTYSNFEVIIIDDGSTDRSIEVLNKYVSEDSRIHLIKQENHGPSSARNLGIKHSTGDYIVFVDIDDYIDPTHLNDYFQYGVNADSLNVQGFTAIREDGSTQIYKTEYSPHEYPIDEGLSIGRMLHFGFPWCKLYRSDIIKQNNIAFIESLRFKEDLIFLLHYLKHCKSIRLIPSASYKAVESSNSLSHKKQSPDSLLTTYEIIIKALPEQSQYTTDFLRLNTQEVLTAIYTFNATASERRKFLQRLKSIISNNWLPKIYKSDRVLSVLFKMRFLKLYDYLQLIIHWLRYQIK